MTPLTPDLVVKVTLVLLLALGADALLRRASAAARHLAWAAGVVAVLLLPVLAAALPSLDTSLPGLPAEVTRVLASGERATAASRDPAGMDGAGPAVGSRYPGSQGAPEKEPQGNREAPVTAATPTSPGITQEVGAAPGPTEPTASSPGHSAGEILLLVWAAGAGAVGFFLLAQLLRVAWLERRSEVFDDARIRRLAADAAGELGLGRVPGLLRGRPRAVPATWGLRRHRLLLPPEATSWSRDRLRAVLLHELAHVRRRDCAVQLLAGLACALYWFHPLAWLAARRLERTREQACDDEVLLRGATAPGYATSLLELARAGKRPGLSPMAATTLARRDGLPKRVESVLAPSRSRRPLTPAMLTGGGALAALLVVPLAALELGAAQGEDGGAATTAIHVASLLGAGECWAPDTPHSMKIHGSGHEWTVEWRSLDCRSDVELRGNVTFNRDFTWIAEVSSGGVFRVREDAGDMTREVVFRGASGGGATVRFSREGRVRPVDAGARRWIEAQILVLLRQTGIAAEERVAWLLESAGPEAVLREVELATGDRAQGRYLGELVEQAEMDDALLVRTLELVGDRLGSDGELSRLLATVGSRYPARIAGTARRAFLGAAATVGSDGDQVRMLTALLESAPETRDLVTLALDAAAATVGSDGDMSRFLVRVARAAPEAVLSGGARGAFLEAAATVGSDGDLTRALSSMLRDADGGREAVFLALEAAATVGSDGEMSRFLVRVASRYGASLRDPEVLTRFRERLSTVGSDGDELRVRRALDRALAGRGEPEAAGRPRTGG